MTTGTSKVRVVLDTNILISGIGFGGKPRKILNLVLERKLQAISSSILLAEFEDIIYKKFPLLSERFENINKPLKKILKIVKPKISLRVVQDNADNHVLEAAVEGKCHYIITGDKDLLDLESYEKIQIVTANEFLASFEKFEIL